MLTMSAEKTWRHGDAEDGETWDVHKNRVDKSAFAKGAQFHRISRTSFFV